ncbi:MAG: ATP-binding cassette domain-containing protein, partial [Actinobacteria bacterium]|nr:ATP-binding cassette domain-containing protein [Actinomycetota bacterium]
MVARTGDHPRNDRVRLRRARARRAGSTFAGGGNELRPGTHRRARGLVGASSRGHRDSGRPAGRRVRPARVHGARCSGARAHAHSQAALADDRHRPGALSRGLRVGEPARRPACGGALYPHRRDARRAHGLPAAGALRQAACGDRVTEVARRPLLEVTQLRIAFGGLTCLSDLDLVVGEGEIVSVIGPNGAGKTTLFNVITGVYRPDAGDVVFDGESVVGLEPNRIARKGIARTFQTLRLFLNMTVRENVMAAAYGHTKAGVVRSVLRTPGMRREEKEIRALAEERLGFFGQRLVGYRWHQPAYSLSYANRRRLEIARATATNPKILLLDEPAAGMNPSETHEIAELI